MSSAAVAGRVLLLALLPVLSGCKESELPVEPDTEPRFTNLVIDRLDADPEPDDNLDAGDLVSFDISGQFQLANGWEDEDLDAYLVIESWSNGAFVRVELSDVDLSVDSPDGTVRFSGSVAVPDCGSVDELTFFIGLWPADGVPDFYADSDFYVVDVFGASSTPCVV